MKQLLICSHKGKRITGIALLRDSSVFEGLINRSYGVRDETVLIVGKIEDEEVEFMMFTRPGNFPYKFSGSITESEILIGTWISEKIIFNEEGRIKIKILQTEVDEAFLKDTNQRMESFKKNMDDYSRKRYYEYINIKKI